MSDVDEYTILQLLKVKGFATAEKVAAGLGVPTADVEPLLKAAVTNATAKYREGRLTGYTLTPAGRERHEVLRSAAVNGATTESLQAAYEHFLAPNRAFKQLTTEWQMRAEGSDPGPLLDRLDAASATVYALLETATKVAPRFAIYRARFERARKALRAGDATAFARPMSDSYHDVWMELHEDLVSSLGQPRSAADE